MAVLVASIAASAALGGPSKSSTKQAGYTAALISDIAGFNDNGFNKNQLKGLTEAAKKVGGTAISKVSHNTSDYAPNFNAAIRSGSKLVIAAGFLLANTEATYAKKFPNVDFAITDYPVEAAPFADKKGKVLFKNVEGITYAANESGCLVGVLAAKMAKKMGGNTIGAVGGIKIPPVDIWIAGYRYCANKAVPGTKTLIQYSNDFSAADKCQTVGENEIGSGAKVLFQVAGGCGLGALKAADDAKIWGIGVDSDEYNDAKRVLTSATKKTDVGVYDTVVSAAGGQFKGGTDLVFNLKNHGVGVGRINPVVPASWIKLMNQYRAKIVAGTLKVPTSLG
ncbi:MAG TPA: BMP family ABC transporter substrate-binding protein [Gaiellaceae bacterium]